MIGKAVFEDGSTPYETIKCRLKTNRNTTYERSVATKANRKEPARSIKKLMFFILETDFTLHLSSAFKDIIDIHRGTTIGNFNETWKSLLFPH